MKNNYLKFSLTLLIICLCSAGLLTVVHSITEPIIEEYIRQQEEKSRKEVFPGGKKFVAVNYSDRDEVNYYKVTDADDNLLGYAFKAQKRGFSSMIQTMVGMNLDGEIINIKVIDQKETPGLGTKIEQVKKGDEWPWFCVRFRGKRADSLDQEVDAITGATISSKAVIDSIQEKAKELSNDLQRTEVRGQKPENRMQRLRVK